MMLVHEILEFFDFSNNLLAVCHLEVFKRFLIDPAWMQNNAQIVD